MKLSEHPQKNGVCAYPQKEGQGIMARWEKRRIEPARQMSSKSGSTMSTIAKLWKEPQCPSKDEWIKKMCSMMWSMYTMEYYSAIRNDKYPPFASTWMELEGIMLSEISQSEDKQCMFSFIWGI